jgi:hypothetical protein
LDTRIERYEEKKSMKIAKMLASNWKFFATLVVLLSWLSVSPNRLLAQTSANAGANSVYKADGTTATQSRSFIDASAFSTTGDICARINAVLTWGTNYPATGTVVDARGIGPGSAQGCSTNPFAGVTVPSEVLLPSGTITISKAWVLPDRTRIAGVGRAGTLPSSSASFTVLLAGPSFTSSCGIGSVTCMVQMCPIPSGSGNCFGVGVEDLMLDGNSQNVVGILNESSQELSYVNRVNLRRIAGTGLLVSSVYAQNSGPYSDIAVGLGSSNPGMGNGECVSIYQTPSTRGIHGLTCSGENFPFPAGTPEAAVYLDASQNSIEDVHTEGFKDGILIGFNQAASSDVLFSISGGNCGGSCSMTNAIHISNAHAGTADISIMGVEADGAANTIEDDVTGTTLTDATVGMYALGESVTNSGTSRFSTSPNTPTWSVGSGVPSGTCKIGSLYSNTAPLGASTTLYLCVPGTISSVWTAH